MYFSDFKKAELFTREIGLSSREVTGAPNVKKFIDDSFFNKLSPYLVIDKPEELAVKCNVVSQVICDVIEKKLNIKAYLTIGSIIFEGGPAFKFDQEFVNSTVASGFGSLAAPNYSHHAWITLESMEIIDFTINTSMALFSKDLSADMRIKMLGGVLSGHADQLTHGLKYVPVLIGEEFYLKYDSSYLALKNLYVKQLKAKGNGVQASFMPVK